MKKLIESLSSKKLLVVIGSLVMLLVERRNEGADAFELGAMAFVSAAYLIGQGLADNGKSRTKELLVALEKGAIDGRSAASQIRQELGLSVAPPPLPQQPIQVDVHTNSPPPPNPPSIPPVPGR